MLPNTLRLYVIAGEASGDLHGSNLIRALKEENHQLDVRCWGGDKMKEQGGTIVKHIKDLAFMGFVEVLLNLRTILKNIRFCKEDILTFKPDALVLIDYPGFNLRIAEWAHKQGIKVYFYISPQVWAWKQSRVYKIKASVDRMYVILPFEKDFYKQFDYEVEFVGHPLLDAINQYRETAMEGDVFRSKHKLDGRPIIAILPGSRLQEVRVKLPIMLEAVRDLDQFQVLIAGAPNIERSYYEKLTFEGVKIVEGETYELLSSAEAAIVTSGTATLETALIGVPEVVCYKGSNISYQIAKRLIKIRFISLVNLIMDKEVVKELIQHECTAQNIRIELFKIIKGGSDRERMIDEYKKLNEILGAGGASKKVALSMLKTIEQAS